MRAKRLIAALLLALVAASPAWAQEEGTDDAIGRRLAQKAASAPGGGWTTADHSKFDALKKDFQRPEEVTEACLSCHTLSAEQIHHTIHWDWICDECGGDGQIGKYGRTINNFCVSVPTNEPRCTSCHIGFGWKDKDFDFTAENKIDCIVCHEQLHTYKKFPTKAGYPPEKPTVFKGNNDLYEPPDWNKLAQSVGRPDRVNCGTCHFNGGGGDGVKHGDLDSSLVEPKKSLDVHMDAEGLDFACTRCHTTKNHKIAGRLYSLPASQERLSLTEADLASKIACESCHSATPHKTTVKANDHTDKVACQACHIPQFARVKPTKLWWDWSKAGRMNDQSKPFTEKGPLGKSSYNSKKGEFVWGKNVVPEYRWFNGAMSYVLVTDEIDPSQPVALNKPMGSHDDPKSRIMPFKVHRGKQPYDKKNGNMVLLHLFGKDGTAYWGNWDWDKSIQTAMEYVGLEYSGEHGFVETEYYYPTTHMVAPKEQTVACAECHSRQGRMAGVAGVYVPGRDHLPWLDAAGWGLAAASLAGVMLHGLVRFIAMRRRNSNSRE
ncbi:tetrathionate reductase family octaheme c-type cytochrome [Desulfohalovibrio reitneri]|uniref:tetrathionate reductase family octaheme c-type cytochrome n=1 Tax=Desulfohalovibrio reitneri TaxID=1307759 RepID=UPI0004A731A8|nr:tetrathionate reductase family octaheme c-type cytochrome [Desulfohalovibrio reitneri]